MSINSRIAWNGLQFTDPMRVSKIPAITLMRFSVFWSSSLRRSSIFATGAAAAGFAGWASAMSDVYGAGRESASDPRNSANPASNSGPAMSPWPRSASSTKVFGGLAASNKALPWAMGISVSNAP